MNKAELYYFLVNKYKEKGLLNYVVNRLLELYNKDFKLFAEIISLVPHKSTKTIATYYRRFRNGGVERVISNLTQLWINLGYKVLLITEENPTKDDYFLNKKVIRKTIDKTDINLRSRQLYTIFKQYNVDTLVYHSYWEYPTNNDFVVSKLYGTNFVLYNHMSINHYYYLNIESYIYKLLKFLNCCDALVVLSKYEYYFFGGFAKKTYVSINPIKIFKCSHSYNNKKILWVGRAEDPIKNILGLIDICNCLKKINPNFKFLIIGEQNSKFHELIMRNKISNYFEFVDYTPEVERYYKECTLFVSTSICETYPMALGEAFASKLPVVMYELPYLTLSKSDGVKAVKYGNYKLATYYINYFLKNSEKCKIAGLKNYEYLTKLTEKHDLNKLWRKIFIDLKVEEPISVNFKKILVSNKIEAEKFFSVIHKQKKPIVHNIKDFICNLILAKK